MSFIRTNIYFTLTKYMPSITNTRTVTRGRSSCTRRDSSSTRLVLSSSSSSRRDRARGSQHLRHAQLHRLHQLRGRECLLLLLDSRLQHSHGRAITAASRNTTPTLVRGRRSQDSRGTQLSPRRHHRAGWTTWRPSRRPRLPTWLLVCSWLIPTLLQCFSILVLRIPSLLSLLSSIIVSVLARYRGACLYLHREGSWGLISSALESVLP
jgi:hypothetical protein